MEQFVIVFLIQKNCCHLKFSNFYFSLTDLRDIFILILDIFDGLK